MRIVVGLPQITHDVEAVVQAAVDAEQAGAWGVSVFDHLEPPWRRGAPTLDGWMLLGPLARRTSRLHLVSLVTRTGVRPEALVARMAALTNAASKGRFVLGLGVGDAGTGAEERRFGVATPSRRRARVRAIEETVRLLKTDATVRPKGSSPAVWVGGAALDLVDLAARLDAGWHGWGLDAKEFAIRARRYRRERPDGVCWWGGIFDPRRAEQTLTELREAGADGVTWTLPSTKDRELRRALLDLVRRSR